MDPSTEAGKGDTETSLVARPKTHHNLSIVYIDHEIDKPTATADDEAEKNSSHHNHSVIDIDHHLDGPGPPGTDQGPNGPVVQDRGGLFRLPPELRIMIWELLLPGKRLLRAKVWCGRDEGSRLRNGSKKIKGCKGRWIFRVDHWNLRDRYPSTDISTFMTPIVLEICRESRMVALQHGSFIFNQRDNSHETGTWWNPDQDVLGFDHSWDLELHSWALANLHGLEHVKRIAMDEAQAWYFYYDAFFNGPDPLSVDRELRDPLAVTFWFRENNKRCHYIPEFFPGFQELTMVFSTIYTKVDRQLFRLRSNARRWDYVVPEDKYSVTFELGSDIKTAVERLRKYRELCMETNVEEPDDDYYSSSDDVIYSVKDCDLDLNKIEHWSVLYPQESRVEGNRNGKRWTENGKDAEALPGQVANSPHGVGRRADTED